MNKHLIRHAVACAALKLVVEISLATACVLAFGWLWSAAVIVLVTGSRLYTFRISERSWRDLVRGERPC